jgi:uncharacterized protein YjiS (DUF1127 family)
MAFFDTTRPADAGLRRGAVALHLLAGLRTWNARRTTRAALSRLSDRQLDDIGLVRGDIDDLH